MWPMGYSILEQAQLASPGLRVMWVWQQNTQNCVTNTQHDFRCVISTCYLSDDATAIFNPTAFAWNYKTFDEPGPALYRKQQRKTPTFSGVFRLRALEIPREKIHNLLVGKWNQSNCLECMHVSIHGKADQQNPNTNACNTFCCCRHKPRKYFKKK